MSQYQVSPAKLTLAASSLGFVLVLLDVSVVNVALEAFRSNFGAGVAGLQWIVNAYTLIFAALLLTSGTLGDRFGAKPVFICGLIVFMLASLACGLAPNLPVLVVARVIQGAGAALLVPNSLSLIQQSFPDREARNRAVGWWGAAGGMALAAGPVLGGVLVTHLGWRSVFFINLPIAMLGFALISRYGCPSPVNAHRPLDWPGQVTAILALSALATALIEAGPLGWADPLILVALCVAVCSGISFLIIEARSPAPMLPLSLFSTPPFAIASFSGIVVNFAYYGLIFVLSLFFQWVQKLSPLDTGLAFLPMTVVLMVMNIIAGRLTTKLGARWLMVFGQSFAAIGYLFLLPISVGGSYWQLTIPMLMVASGIALTVPTMTNLTLSSVEPSRAGLASGVLNSARQVGGLLGVAICGYLVGNASPDTFVKGMHLSIGLAVAALGLGALFSFAGLKREH